MKYLLITLSIFALLSCTKKSINTEEKKMETSSFPKSNSDSSVSSNPKINWGNITPPPQNLQVSAPKQNNIQDFFQSLEPKVIDEKENTCEYKKLVSFDNKKTMFLFSNEQYLIKQNNNEEAEFLRGHFTTNQDSNFTLDLIGIGKVEMAAMLESQNKLNSILILYLEKEKTESYKEVNIIDKCSETFENILAK